MTTLKELILESKDHLLNEVIEQIDTEKMVADVMMNSIIIQIPETYKNKRLFVEYIEEKK